LCFLPDSFVAVTAVAGFDGSGRPSMPGSFAPNLTAELPQVDLAWGVRCSPTHNKQHARCHWHLAQFWRSVTDTYVCMSKQPQGRSLWASVPLITLCALGCHQQGGFLPNYFSFYPLLRICRSNLQQQVAGAGRLACGVLFCLCGSPAPVRT
jgi:hypothetical protein